MTRLLKHSCNLPILNCVLSQFCHGYLSLGCVLSQFCHGNLSLPHPGAPTIWRPLRGRHFTLGGQGSPRMTRLPRHSCHLPIVICVLSQFCHGYLSLGCVLSQFWHSTLSPPLPFYLGGTGLPHNDTFTYAQLLFANCDLRSLIVLPR